MKALFYICFIIYATLFLLIGVIPFIKRRVRILRFKRTQKKYNGENRASDKLKQELFNNREQ